MDKPLNARERRFVGEYLIDLDPKRAAIAAGYSPSVAASKAFQWVSNSKVRPHVYLAIQAAMKRREVRTGITAERVLQEYARVALVDLRALMEWGPNGVKVKPSQELTDEQAAAVAEVSETVTQSGKTVRVKLHNKLAALDSLAKHLGLLKGEGGQGERNTETHPLDRLTASLEAYLERRRDD